LQRKGNRNEKGFAEKNLNKELLSVALPANALSRPGFLSLGKFYPMFHIRWALFYSLANPL
jgi:hypothetical protein